MSEIIFNNGWEYIPFTEETVDADHFLEWNTLHDVDRINFSMDIGLTKPEDLVILISTPMADEIWDLSEIEEYLTGSEVMHKNLVGREFNHGIVYRLKLKTGATAIGTQNASPIGIYMTIQSLQELMTLS